MKVKVTVRPSGLINGQEWPEVGEVMDLPDVVVADMADYLEPVKAAPKPQAKKAAEKVEKRPAPRKGVETRKD